MKLIKFSDLYPNAEKDFRSEYWVNPVTGSLLDDSLVPNKHHFSCRGKEYSISFFPDGSIEYIEEDMPKKLYKFYHVICGRRVEIRIKAETESCAWKELETLVYNSKNYILNPKK